MKYLYCLFTILLVFFFVSPVSARYSVEKITDNDYDDCYFNINGSGSIVWVGYGTCDYEIHRFTDRDEIFLFADGETTQLTDNEYLDNYPWVNNYNHVAWMANGDISLFDGESTRTISDPEQISWIPKINDQDHAVWYRVYTGYSGKSDVMYYDGTNAVNITDDLLEDNFIQLNENNYLAWDHYMEDGSGYEIVLFDGINTTFLTDNTTSDVEPNLNDNNWLVWEHWYEEGSTAIYLYNGVSITNLTEGSYQSRHPKLNNNNHAVWLEHRFYDWGVYNDVVIFYDGTNTTTISGENYNSDHPEINNQGQIVWEGFDGNDWEIFVYDGAIVHQLTDNCVDDFRPKIADNGDVVWTRSDGNDYEIYRARPVSALEADSWAVTYGNEGDETGTSVEQTEDSGFIISGTKSTVYGEDIWIIKTDAEGVPEWQRTYGGAGDETATIRQTGDGGFILAGTSDSFGAGGKDIWVAKLTASGDVEWQKAIGGTGSDRAADIQEHACSGGFILAGTTDSFGSGQDDIWIIKMDSDGDIEWQKTFGTDYPERATSVIIDSDEGYVVTSGASSHTFGSNQNADFMVLKLDSVGEVQWQKIHGTTNVDYPRSIVKALDGGYVVVGESVSLEYGIPYTHTRILKLDAGGNVSWHKSYGALLRHDFPTDIQKTLDGAYVMSGYRQRGDVIKYTDAWTIKVDTDGDIIWQTYFAGENSTDSESAISVFPVNDGGFMTVGTTNSSGIGGSDILLTRLDENGQINDCTLGAAYDMEPITTENDSQDTDFTVTTPEPVITPTLSYVINTSAYRLNPCGSIEVAGVIALPQTGQTDCYDDDGNIIDCTSTGQDGEFQMGVPWPEPRFMQNSDETITDLLTGLVWSAYARTPETDECTIPNNFGWVYWPEGLDHIACLNSNSYLGYNDWRIPNINELMSLSHYGTLGPASWLIDQGFLSPSVSWASTPGFVGLDTVVLSAWYMNLTSTDVTQAFYGIGGGRRLLPVRGPDASGNIELPRTGVKSCHDTDDLSLTDCTGTGQDGESQIGAEWPEPRFIKNSDATVTDLLTGLIWTRSASLTDSTEGCGEISDNYGKVTWQEALDWVACINNENMMGHNDWRLPNINEIRSLIDYSREEPALPENHPFTNVIVDNGYGTIDGYWTSTSRPGDASMAYSISLFNGTTGKRSKTLRDYHVWPVRGGQLTACTIGISPVNASYGANSDSGTISITTPDSCDWTAVSNDDWIVVTSGSSGSGNGVVEYTVAANSAETERTGTVTIGSKTFTIKQTGLYNTVLSLGESWNLISIFQTPSVTEIAQVLEPISGQYISVWAYTDGHWRVYDPSNPGFSDLEYLTPGKGYWVNMSGGAEISVSGPASLDPINFSSGWNLVGFNSTESQTASDAVASIESNIISIWRYKNTRWEVYDPTNPGFSDLEVMEPGYGYWFNIGTPCLWETSSAE